MDFENILFNSVSITVVYDENLQKITGRPFDKPLIGPNAFIEFILRSVFVEYPRIEKDYPAGSLGIMVNGIPPFSFQPLHEGDVVHLIGYPSLAKRIKEYS